MSKHNCRTCKRVKCPEGDIKMVSVIFTKDENHEITCNIESYLLPLTDDNVPKFFNMINTVYYDNGFAIFIPTGKTVNNIQLSNVFSVWVNYHCNVTKGRFNTDYLGNNCTLSTYMPTDNAKAREYVAAINKATAYCTAFYKALYNFT